MPRPREQRQFTQASGPGARLHTAGKRTADLSVRVVEQTLPARVYIMARKALVTLLAAAC